MKRITWYTVIFLFVAYLISFVYYVNAYYGSEQDREGLFFNLLKVSYDFYLLPITLLLNIHLFLLLKESYSSSFASFMIIFNIVITFLFEPIYGVITHESIAHLPIIFALPLPFFIVTSITTLTIFLSKEIHGVLRHFLSVSFVTVVFYLVLVFSFSNV